MPVGEARLERYDPLVLISKHADIAVERDGALFHACLREHGNPILQDRANDGRRPVRLRQGLRQALHAAGDHDDARRAARR
jgi:hypothetical protein